MPEIHQTSTEVFAFPLAIALISIVVAVVCLFLSVRCFRHREARRFGWLLLAGALIAAGIVAPALLRDRITVTPQEITSTGGFWFSPTREGFTYQEVHHVRVTTYRELKGRVGAAWDVHYLDGRVHQIPLGDLWMHNSDRIMALLRRHGVHFTK